MLDKDSQLLELLYFLNKNLVNNLLKPLLLGCPLSMRNVLRSSWEVITSSKTSNAVIPNSDEAIRVPSSEFMATSTPIVGSEIIMPSGLRMHPAYWLEISTF